MSIVFVGSNGRTSGQIRGMQIADRMPRAKFIDADVLRVNQVHGWTVVFVRSIDTQKAWQLRRQGCRIGFDLLDRPVADYHAQRDRGRAEGDIDWRRYDIPEVDFFIVNNTWCKDNLDDIVGTRKQIHVIPHHTVNFENHVNDFWKGNTPIRKVGYVGLADQFTVTSEVKAICEKYGVEFVSVHPNTREECVEVMKTIDLGLIYADRSERIAYTMLGKPNTKLSNFQSFGIPTIACSYESFIEFGEGAWIRANNQDEFLSLLDDTLARKNTLDLALLAEKASLVGRKFHIDSVIEKYYSKIASETP